MLVSICERPAPIFHRHWSRQSASRRRNLVALQYPAKYPSAGLVAELYSLAEGKRRISVGVRDLELGHVRCPTALWDGIVKRRSHRAVVVRVELPNKSLDGISIGGMMAFPPIPATLASAA